MNRFDHFTVVKARMAYVTQVDWMPLDGNHLLHASECAMKNAHGHILFTGGAGYNGSHMMRALHDA